MARHVQLVGRKVYFWNLSPWKMSLLESRALKPLSRVPRSNVFDPSRRQRDQEVQWCLSKPNIELTTRTEE